MMDEGPPAEGPFGLPEVERDAEPALQCGSNVLEDRQVGKDGRNLEGADNFSARRLAGALVRDVGSQIRDGSTRGSQELREQIEERGLAGAIRADERVDVTTTHLQVHFADGNEPLELDSEAALRHMLDHIGVGGRDFTEYLATNLFELPTYGSAATGSQRSGSADTSRTEVKG